MLGESHKKSQNIGYYFLIKKKIRHFKKKIRIFWIAINKKQIKWHTGEGFKSKKIRIRSYEEKKVRA